MRIDSRSLLSTAITLTAFLFVVSETAAQFRSVTVDGSSSNLHFGSAISGDGDFNGDGATDILIGAPQRAHGPGLIQIRSGRDRSRILFETIGDRFNAQFGEAVNWAGDLNGDGMDEFIVGAPGAGTIATRAGKAFVYAGGTGELLFEFEGSSAHDEMGRSVDGVEDLDGDGCGELIVGIPGDGGLSLSNGRVNVYSGKDGARLFSFYGDNSRDLFGYSVSGLGDQNLDGVPDLLIGAMHDSNFGPFSGTARILSGRDGSLLRQHNGRVAGARFGAVLDSLGDLDQDGFEEYIVGAFSETTSEVNAGSARVFSGSDGRLMYEYLGQKRGQYLGTSVSAGGDLNGDRRPDFLIGSPGDDRNGASSGSAAVYSGLDGSLLYDFVGGEAFDSFGRAVSAGGRGLSPLAAPTIAVGAPLDKGQGQSSGSTNFIQTRFPGLTTSAFDPGVAGTRNRVIVLGAEPYAVVVLLWSPARGLTPVEGCNGLWFALDQARARPPRFAGRIGAVGFNFDVPAKASGLTLHLQAFEPARCALGHPISDTFQ